ncbi:DnaJ family domain-containing protein, partial [Actibacterium sp.]
MKWRDLAERQIKKAQAEGQLDNLKGAGKPL